MTHCFWACGWSLPCWFLPSCLTCQNHSHHYPSGLFPNYHILNPPSEKITAFWIILQFNPSLLVYFYPNEVHFTVVQSELLSSSCASFNCYYSHISIMSLFSSRLLMKNTKWNRTQTLQQWKKYAAQFYHVLSPPESHSNWLIANTTTNILF